MPFFSFFFFRKNDNHNGQDERGAIVTADRATADQFYRCIQERGTFCQSIVFRNLKRLGYNMWTWEGDRYEILEEFVATINGGATLFPLDAELRALKGRVCIQWLPHFRLKQHWPISQAADDVADHISGHTFFVRNKLSPKQFWYLHNGVVKISTGNRSKFRIEMAKQEDKSDLVMIPSDRVVLSHVKGTTSSPVTVDARGYMVMGEGRERSFEFGAFSGGFEVKRFSKKENLETSGDEAESEIIKYPRLFWDDSVSGKRNGDVWELC